jgi:hypothetical protein
MIVDRATGSRRTYRLDPTVTDEEERRRERREECELVSD